ncbi:class I SAM-dependent methyltransferase [Paenibacillus sacheonensis]|uniref:Methyltransferase domain-containing protein n=1 Tax=Paenibacillus sacheonensis TaxID=742054 RepID=A0A7X4YJX8_9BACL|nr:methyltransferase domain-containing protein [Paenibacillus sacheonensis]MBM7563874.1 SAM-dependent methyltransferase [Paenibacillus sacheonensis]NBC67778.1 methyltransferase domain-containing protein [Paenibacillus sacheonensis]
MQRVDLGCGLNKHRDCMGIDVDASLNPDLVHDLNERLPLEDDSVSFLLACRSLEYAKDLRGVMKEIYRVCKHKAVVCIVAPHAQAAIHVANPSIRSAFNEYTPYYLTPKEHHHEIVSAVQFSPEFIPAEPSEMDFRLLRMEFFYFPLYLSPLYEPGERMGLMEVQLNMVDEILYHFVVVKEPITKQECSRMSGSLLEEPARIKERRLHDGMLARQSAAENVIEPAPVIAEEEAEEVKAAGGEDGQPKSAAGTSKSKPKSAAKAKPDAKTKPKGKAKAVTGKTKQQKQMQIKMVEPEPAQRARVYKPSRVVFERKEE